jgi:NitT/TauT family transport system substrate-binding protein
LDSGIFARAGLNVQIQAFPNGAAIASAILGGAIDLGLMDVLQVANASVRNIPLVFFAPGTLYNSTAPTSALCTAKDSTLRTAKDLEGQAIAVNGVKTMSECATREWMRLNGADSMKAQFVELPPPAVVPAIQRGTVAAAVVSEPALSQAGDGVRILAWPYTAVAKRFFIVAYAAQRDWLQQNTPLARSIAGAIIETAHWANANHPATATILAKYAKVEPDQLAHMTRVTLGDALTPQLVQPSIDVAVRYQAVARPVAASDIIVRV